MKQNTAFFARLLKKAKASSGETIVETLAAMLIITLSFVMLCGAVVAAANINASIDPADASFSIKSAEYTGVSVSVEHKYDSSSSTETYGSSDSIRGYKTKQNEDSNEDLYFYYECD